MILNQRAQLTENVNPILLNMSKRGRVNEADCPTKPQITETYHTKSYAERPPCFGDQKDRPLYDRCANCLCDLSNSEEEQRAPPEVPTQSSSGAKDSSQSLTIYSLDGTADVYEEEADIVALREGWFKKSRPSSWQRGSFY